MASAAPLPRVARSSRKVPFSLVTTDKPVRREEYMQPHDRDWGIISISLSASIKCSGGEPNENASRAATENERPHPEHIDHDVDGASLTRPRMVLKEVATSAYPPFGEPGARHAVADRLVLFAAEPQALNQEGEDAAVRTPHREAPRGARGDEASEGGRLPGSASVGTLGEEMADAGSGTVAEIERRASPAVAWMQNAGVPFDATGWRDHLERVEADVERLRKELAQLAPVHTEGGEWNWRSPQQVKAALALAGIKLPNSKEETLDRLDHPLAKVLLEYRKASKTVGSFGSKLLEAVQEDGRIYASWRQTGAQTGRMSCRGPNVQQLPQEVRRYVRAPDGRALVWVDYRQAEIRILACASGDHNLVEAFRADKDPYKATAASMFGVQEEEVTEEQRAAAKVITFSFVFGATAFGIAKKLGVPVHEARRLKGLYFAAHPRVEAFLGATVQKLLDTGQVHTLTGRARRFGDIQSMNRKEAGAAVREAMNLPMQGSCADGFKLALGLLHERRHECPGAVPIIALHDEILIECDEDDVEGVASWLERAMKDGMAEVLALGVAGEGRVPVEVETKSGKFWGLSPETTPPAPEHADEENTAASSRPDYGPVSVRVYIDYRDPSVDAYPQIEACDDCAEALGVGLGEQDDIPPAEAAWCELCDAGNARAR